MNLEQRIDLKYEKMQNTAPSNILPLWFEKTFNLYCNLCQIWYNFYILQQRVIYGGLYENQGCFGFMFDFHLSFFGCMRRRTKTPY